MWLEKVHARILMNETVRDQTGTEEYLIKVGYVYSCFTSVHKACSDYLLSYFKL